MLSTFISTRDTNDTSSPTDTPQHELSYYQTLTISAPRFQHIQQRKYYLFVVMLFLGNLDCHYKKKCVQNHFPDHTIFQQLMVHQSCHTLAFLEHDVYVKIVELVERPRLLHQDIYKGLSIPRQHTP